MVHSLGPIVWEYLVFHCVSISVTGLWALSDRLSAAWLVVDKTKSPASQQQQPANQPARPEPGGGPSIGAVNVNGHRVHRFGSAFCPRSLRVEFHTKITLFGGAEWRNGARGRGWMTPIMTCQLYACHMAYAQRARCAVLTKSTPITSDLPRSHLNLQSIHRHRHHHHITIIISISFLTGQDHKLIKLNQAAE